MTLGLLLDRDGTINVPAPEGEYITSPGQVRLLPGAAEGIARFNRAGYRVAVVSNQRGVALGRMTVEDVGRVNDAIAAALVDREAHVDRWYICPHDVGACDCRKPAPGLLLRALTDLGLDPAGTLMVGDAESDVAAGEALGLRTVRILPTGGAGLRIARRDRTVVPDLQQLADLVLGR